MIKSDLNLGNANFITMILWALKYFEDLKISEYFKESICRENLHGIQMVKFESCWKSNKEKMRNS